MRQIFWDINFPKILKSKVLFFALYRQNSNCIIYFDPQNGENANFIELQDYFLFDQINQINNQCYNLINNQYYNLYISARKNYAAAVKNGNQNLKSGRLILLAEIFQKICFIHNKFMKFSEIAIFGSFNHKYLKTWHAGEILRPNLSKNLSDLFSIFPI